MVVEEGGSGCGCGGKRGHNHDCVERKTVGNGKEEDNDEHDGWLNLDMHGLGTG